jgi:transposase
MEKLPDTIEECHQIIRLLQGALSDLSKKVELLAAENRDLKERLNGNSSNSSLPPSKDIKKKKKQNGHKPSGKQSGGQPGHKGHYRELLTSEAVDSIEECALPKQCVCGGEIRITGEYLRHQVYELPKLELQVTEYRLEKGCCDKCCANQIASLPEGISWGITGPRLTSFMSELVTKYGLSRREQQRFLKEQLDFEISLGTVFNKQKVVNAALEAPVSELLPIVKESNSVYVDETGHNRDGKSQWLWVK